jgi:hypothetical protein
LQSFYPTIQFFFLLSCSLEEFAEVIAEVSLSFDEDDVFEDELFDVDEVSAEELEIPFSLSALILTQLVLL